MSLILAGLEVVGSSLLSSHPKDATRLQRNAVAYAKAVTGDDNALNFLLYRSGPAAPTINGYLNYDSSYMGDLGNQDPHHIAVGGWPTDTARNDAKAKYNGAVQARQKAGAALAGLGVQVAAGNTGATAGQAVSTVTSGLFGNIPTGWIIAAVVVLLLLFFR